MAMKQTTCLICGNETLLVNQCRRCNRWACGMPDCVEAINDKCHAKLKKRFKESKESYDISTY
jgi:hypothetical protein